MINSLIYYKKDVNINNKMLFLKIITEKIYVYFFCNVATFYPA